MDNEYLIRKLVKLFQYKQNQLLKGRLLGSAIPNTLVDVQTDVGIKKALNLNITSAVDDCLVTKDIDSNQLVVFSLPRSNNTRNIEIINRKQRSIKKDTEQLDAAILYAVKEEKNYSVDFINPTWVIEFDPQSDSYICSPVPEPNSGVYPSLSTCLTYAEKLRQESNEGRLVQYNRSLSLYNQELENYYYALANIDSLIEEFFIVTKEEPSTQWNIPLSPFIIAWRNHERVISSATRYRAEGLDTSQNTITEYQIQIWAYDDGLIVEPPFPQTIGASSATTASNIALSFFYKKSLKSEAVKILEVNEYEYVEPILVKQKNTEAIVFKLGREKRNDLITDVGGGGSGTSGGGEPDSYWTVTDLQRWHCIRVYNTPQENVYEEFTYNSAISLSNNLINNYQYWRFENYILYPFPQDTNTCFINNEWLHSTSEETKYNTIINYQLNTNKISKDVLGEFKLTDYDFNYLLLKDIEIFYSQILLNKINNNGTMCNKQIIKNRNVDLKLPKQVISIIIKPYVI